MPKRARGGQRFGGGSGDVNPQWFNMTVSGNLAAAYQDVGTSMPRERLPFGNKSQVMEVLKVQFTMGPTQTFVLTAATAASVRCYLTTTSFGTAEPLQTQFSGRIVAKKRIDFASTAAAAAATVYVGPGLDEPVDVTDGAGNGILVATDSIFIGCIQTGNTNPITGGVIGSRVLYRWKNVALSEYIGIVQSQS